MEEEQKEHVAKLNKMEREMEEVFERKVLQSFLGALKSTPWLVGAGEEAEAGRQRARPWEETEREHNQAAAAQEGARGNVFISSTNNFVSTSDTVLTCVNSG